MMVVMVVSRRVGQVTLAVSERTSCRNLNGLKAIGVPRPSSDDTVTKGNPNVRAGAQPSRSRRMSRNTGSDVWGCMRPRRISALGGPAASGGYLLLEAPEVKAGAPGGARRIG